MMHPVDEPLTRLLRAALPAHEGAAGSDLWPRVRDRIDRGTPPPTAWDWTLIALIAITCLLEPAAASMLLFHL